MAILIIEGPDLSGKTYAIEKIAKHFNSGFVLKNAFKPKAATDSKKLYAHYWSLINLIIDREDLVIMDRFFPSQAVYSYLRGEDEMFHGEIQALDHYGAATGFLYLYLDTPIESLLKRFDERGDEHIKKDMLMKLKERYDLFYDESDMTKFRVDTTEEDWLERVEGFVLLNTKVKK